MIDRVEKFDVMKLQDFIALVTELKMEFEVKGFKLDIVRVFQETMPTEADRSQVRELLDELSLDLNTYCNAFQDALARVLPTPKRSEILQTGVAHMKLKLDVLHEALTSEKDKETLNEILTNDIARRIAFLQKCVAKDEVAIENSLRVEEKMINTPKRRKCAAPDTVMTQLEEDVEICVWDSTSEMRYFVLPEAPNDFQNKSLDELESMVSRNSMIGVEKIKEPENRS